MDFWDVVEDRRSVRSFEPRSVPREVIDRLLKAAGRAPSSFNSQPWRFHVATGRTRTELGEVVARTTIHLREYIDVFEPDHYEEAVRWYSSLGEAPVVIGVSMPNPDSEFDNMNKLLSVGAACENLMLAATAEGLGVCNITFVWWVRDALAEALQVEPGRRVVSLMALGFPKHPVHPRTMRRADISDYLD